MENQIDAKVLEKYRILKEEINVVLSEMFREFLDIQVKRVYGNDWINNKLVQYNEFILDKEGKGSRNYSSQIQSKRRLYGNNFNINHFDITMTSQVAIYSWFYIISVPKIRFKSYEIRKILENYVDSQFLDSLDDSKLEQVLNENIKKDIRILYDCQRVIKNNREYKNTCFNTLNKFRTHKNSATSHFSEFDNIIKLDSYIANAINEMDEFIKYLKGNWNYQNKDVFIEKYAKAINKLNSQKLNISSGKGNNNIPEKRKNINIDDKKGKYLYTSNDYEENNPSDSEFVKYIDVGYRIGDIKKYIIGIIIIFIVGFFFFRPKSTTIDISRYVDVSLSGYQNNGVIAAEVNWEEMKEDYKEKFSNKTDTIIEEIQNATTLDYDDFTKYSNNDITTIKVKVDDYKSIEKKYKIKIKEGQVGYRVMDLGEYEPVDVFEGVGIVFKGLTPKLVPSIKYTGKYEFDESYFIFNKEMYSNGETVKIKFTKPGELSEKYNVVPITDTLELKVDDCLPRYYRTFEELSDDALEELKNYSYNIIKERYGSGFISATYGGALIFTTTHDEVVCGLDACRNPNELHTYFNVEATKDGEYKNFIVNIPYRNIKIYPIGGDLEKHADNYHFLFNEVEHWIVKMGEGKFMDEFSSFKDLQKVIDEYYKRHLYASGGGEGKHYPTES